VLLFASGRGRRVPDSGRRPPFPDGWVWPVRDSAPHWLRLHARGTRDLTVISITQASTISASSFCSIASGFARMIATYERGGERIERSSSRANRRGFSPAGHVRPSAPPLAAPASGGGFFHPDAVRNLVAEGKNRGSYDGKPTCFGHRSGRVSVRTKPGRAKKISSGNLVYRRTRANFKKNSTSTPVMPRRPVTIAAVEHLVSTRADLSDPA